MRKRSRLADQMTFELRFGLFARIIVPCLVLAFIILIFLESQAQPSRFDLVPRILGFVAIGLTVLEGGRWAARRLRGQSWASDITTMSGSSEPFFRRVQRMLFLSSAILGLGVGTWVIGINLAVPLFLLIFLRFRAKWTWHYSLVGAVGSGVVLYVVHTVFRLSFPPSLLDLPL